MNSTSSNSNGKTNGERKHTKVAKGVVKVKPTPENSRKVHESLAQRFPDVKMFGATLPRLTGTGRGPIQIGMAESIDPVVPTRLAITRVAVATEKEEENQDGANRGMGGLWMIPYGLYRFHTYINPNDALRTGLTEGDYADLFIPALVNLFDNDRATGRTGSCIRAIYEFRHVEFKATNKPSCTIGGEALLEMIEVERKDPTKAPRAFSDYSVKIPQDLYNSQDFTFREIVVNGKINLPTVAEDKKNNILSARIELVVLMDFKNSNPQGDPDNGNCPRTDPETSRGLVTMVGIRRKIRDNLSLWGHPIYIARGSCLGRTNREVAKEIGCDGIFSGKDEEGSETSADEAEAEE